MKIIRTAILVFMLASVLGIASPGRANVNFPQTPNAESPVEVSTCDVAETLLAQAYQLTPTKKEYDRVPAMVRTDYRLEVTRLHPKKGSVTARVIKTGEIVHFDVGESTLQEYDLRVGTIVGADFVAVNSKGRCKCGQDRNGDCWCVDWICECCGISGGIGCRCSGNCLKPKDIRNGKPEILQP